MERRRGHWFKKITNLILVALCCWLLLVIAFHLYPQQRHTDVTLWMYGAETPLLGSGAWDFLISPVTSIFAVILIGATIAKEFLLTSFRRRYAMNAAWLLCLVVFWFSLSSAFFPS